MHTTYTLLFFFRLMPSGYFTGYTAATMMRAAPMLFMMMPALTLGENVSIPLVDVTERNDFNSLVYGIGNVPTLKKDSNLLSDIPTLIYFAVIFMVFIIGDRVRDQ
jgi:hypothetical protein